MAEILYLSMVIIGVGSFIIGILPSVFSFRVTHSSPFFLSLVLCLGAGVLLATSLVHMLTEVQPKLKLFTQLYFCAGFLTLYTFDEISHYCLVDSRSESNLRCGRRQNRRNNYVAREENSSLLESNHGRRYDTPPGEKNFDHSRFSADENARKPKPKSSGKMMEIRIIDQRTNSNMSRSHYYGLRNLNKSNEERSKIESEPSILDAYLHSENGDQYHVECNTEEENWSPNPATKTGLLMALLIHSILEGVSIGVQTEMSQIMLILGAVTFHKIVLSFCLGLELLHHGFRKLQLLLAIFIFSIGSPIGITIGMTVTSIKYGIFGIDAQLQAVAAGSLLYVATFEVLPRERFKWQRSNKKAAGIFQLIFLLIGFTLITVFHFYIDPSNSTQKISNATESLTSGFLPATAIR